MNESTAVIEYENSFEDLLEFNVLHMRTSQTGKRLRLTSAAMAAVIVLVFGVSFSISGEVPWMIGPFFLLALAAGAATRPLVLRSVRKSAERLYGEGKNVGMTGWHRLSVSGEELREESAAGSQITNLAAVERIIETADRVYIYVSAIMAHVIPRDRVVDGDLKTFLEILRERIGE